VQTSTVEQANFYLRDTTDLLALRLLLRLLAVALLLRGVVVTPASLAHLLLARRRHAAFALLLHVADLALLLREHARVKGLHQAVHAHLDLVRHVAADQVENADRPRDHAHAQDDHVVHPAVPHLEARLNQEAVARDGAAHAAERLQAQARDLGARLLQRTHRAHAAAAEVLFLVQKLQQLLALLVSEAALAPAAVAPAHGISHARLQELHLPLVVHVRVLILAKRHLAMIVFVLMTSLWL